MWRKEFFGTDPRVLELVSHLSDEQLASMRRGGHSYSKVYAAYHRAMQNEGQGRPTAILVHTIKGWSLGEGFEGVNSTHQKKKMDAEELKGFRDLLALPIPDEALKDKVPPFYHPGKDSPEYLYCMERRRALGGCLPQRRSKIPAPIGLPDQKFYDEFEQGMAKGEASTTMVFSRLVAKMIRDKKVGKRVVPSFRTKRAPSAWTLSSLRSASTPPRGSSTSRSIRASSSITRKPKTVRCSKRASPKPDPWRPSLRRRRATPFSGADDPIFHLLFDVRFQRVGDQIWAAGDMMARGFLLGATAGRTTLNGEGLQHEDGHSLLHTMGLHEHQGLRPRVCFRGVDHRQGRHAAHVRRERGRFLLPDALQRRHADASDAWHGTLGRKVGQSGQRGARASKLGEGIVRGIYLFQPALERKALHVQLLGSGPIMNRVLEARDLLAERYGVSADVWSVTSYQQLRFDALEADRYNRMHPEAEQRVPYITQTLSGVTGPFIAASDYVKALPDLVRQWIPGRLVSLGTEGYGMSDTRETLRRHFEIDRETIAIGVLDALYREGKLDAKKVSRAIVDLGVDPDKLDPLHV